MIGTSTTEAGARFGLPGSVFGRLLVSKRLSTIALLILAVAGITVGVVMAALLHGAQRHSSDQTCRLRAQLLATHVNETITFLGAVNALVNAGGYVSDPSRFSPTRSAPAPLAELAQPSGLLCWDVAVEVRNRTEYGALRIIPSPGSGAALYPVVLSTCAGRVLGVDLALAADASYPAGVRFRASGDGTRLDSVVVPDADHVLVGYLALDDVPGLTDLTVRNAFGRVLYSERTASAGSALAASTTMRLPDDGLWSASCWSRSAEALGPYLIGASVAALITVLVVALAYGLRQSRDHHQRYLHVGDDQLGGRQGRLVEFLCARFQQVAVEAAHQLQGLLDRDEAAPALALDQRHALVQAETQIGTLRSMCDQYVRRAPGRRRRRTDPRRLADLCALEAGRRALSPAPFATAALFQTLERRFRAQAEAHGVRLGVRLQATLPPVLISDRDRLEQIVFNALSNALAVTPRGGSVTLEAQIGAVLDAGASTQRLALLLSVTDTGSPVPDAVVEAVRRPDADLICSPDYGGLGLLTIKKLSAMLGGRVTLSTRPNRLSVVVEVQFERRRSMPAANALSSASTAPAQARRAAAAGILLVSGESASIVLVQAMAAQVGDLPLTVTRDLVESLHLLGVPNQTEVALDFALILIDTSGYKTEDSVIAAIRQIRAAGLTIPIAVMTGGSGKSALIGAGADVILSKPFTQQQLLGVVTTWGSFGLNTTADQAVAERTAIPAVTVAGARYNPKKEDPRSHSVVNDVLAT